MCVKDLCVNMSLCSEKIYLYVNMYRATAEMFTRKLRDF